jgi:hypothetical protein
MPVSWLAVGGSCGRAPDSTTGALALIGERMKER